MSLKSGSQPKLDKKLHCIKCAKKRLMVLALPFPKEDGSTGAAFINIKTLLKMLRDNTLPNQKEVAFPTSNLVAKCLVCQSNTFYNIKDGKLVANTNE
jgi:hypothetical protein